MIDVLTAPHAFCEATSDVLTAQGSFRLVTSGGLSTPYGFCVDADESQTEQGAHLQHAKRPPSSRRAKWLFYKLYYGRSEPSLVNDD